MANIPSGRKKNVSGTGSDVRKKGEGLGTGPVGKNSGSNQIRHDGQKPSGTPGRAAIGGSGLLILVVIFFLAKGLLGGGGTTPDETQQSPISSLINYNLSGASSFNGWGSALSSVNTGTSTSPSQSSPVDTATLTANNTSNAKKLDTTVASGSRSKYTAIKGGGNDTITLMVYMCGTDLESNYSMASKDLEEMARATSSGKINIIIYTGGCKNWHTQGISNTKNQIWQLTKGSIVKQEETASAPMVKASTLSGFIRYCAENFQADRYDIILWDHGGGSITGYGYDEKYANASLTLADLDQAFNDGGVKFDFIGYDACLMATAETALTMAKYGDYMIASEESEPGIGWYYTGWLTKLAANTSMSTLEIGKNICDDFVTVCGQQCRGQKATLSVVDLAEAAHTIPAALNAFSTSTSGLLKNDNYAQVSNARSGAREFAVSSRIDQVDLVDLCNGMNTREAAALAKAVRSAVKYNNTSSDMTNSYGLSIYFPYKNVRTVDTAVKTYKAIGMDEDYQSCIQEFAAMGTGGQAISGGASSPLSALLSGYTQGGTTAQSSSDITSILSGLLGGSSTYNVSGLSSGAMGFLQSALGGRCLSLDDTVKYLDENRFDPEALVWTEQKDGRFGIKLDQDNWSLVQALKLSLFVDDGEGYIDLGLDNVFELTEDGVLLAEEQNSWIYIGGQAVAYYFTDSNTENGQTSYYGYVPALLTDPLTGLEEQRIELLLANTDGDWEICGFRPVYADGETEAQAKAAEALNDGAVLQFIADYYSYEGEYMDTFRIGDEVTVNGSLAIADKFIPETTKTSAAYVLTDIYQQEYWTPVVPEQEN